MSGGRFRFGKISEMRDCLFGLAIFCIMVFHSPLVLERYSIRFFKVFLNIGVEIFLILSAVGLYRSLEGDGRLGRFYYKRALRTVLPLMPVVLVWFGYFDLLGGAGWRAFFEDVTLISFWTKGFRTEWFVALILVLYLVYPVLHRIRGARGGALWIWVLIAVFAALNIVWAKLDRVSYERTEIAFSRIPAFLLGLWIAPAVWKDRAVPRGTLWGCAAVFLALFVFKFFGRLDKPWSRLINAPLGFLLVLMLAQALSALKGRPVMRRVEQFFAFLGGFTLELYLLHEKILYALLKMGLPRGPYGLLAGAAAIAAAIPAAWLYSRICGAVRGRLPDPRA